MAHDPAASLLGAYALDALDDAERVRVEAHLADCSRCRAEVSRHQYIVALLGTPRPPSDPD